MFCEDPFPTLHHPCATFDTIWARARVSHARIASILSAIEENKPGLQHCCTLSSLNHTSISMGAVVSLIVPVVTAVAGLLSNLRSKPAGNNPTHTDIETANRLQREQQERDREAQIAEEEADRLAQEAEMNIQRARDAQAAMEAAQAEAERIRTEAEKTRVAA
ncbi:hypothetical protein B0H14DRAFT_3577397, partial [Mycena olivaceomarginata]